MLKFTLAVTALLIGALPLSVSAHAIPVASSPESSAVLAEAPSHVVITFSEHIDEAASSIRVTGPSGAEVSVKSAETDPGNTHIFSVPIRDDGEGAYTVSWNSVSSDDGHFTKGAYPFVIGAGQVTVPSSSSVEIIKLSTTPEALGSAVELAGHGFLWAILLLFAFAIRPLIASGKFDEDRSMIGRLYTYFTSLGALLVFFGGHAQLAVKTDQLADLRSVDLVTAFHIYVGTDAGLTTIVRIAAVSVYMAIFLFGRTRIVTGKKFTVYEMMLVLALCCFAYFRAKISHAASNPFYPDFSVFVNFFHLIEKDIWAGLIGILLVLTLLPRMRRLLSAILPRAFQMLAIDFGLVAVTAAYIVWLHLKTFANVFSTSWGGTFLELLLVAVALIGVRIYHVLARWYRPALFSRLLPSTLAAEFALALLVVYCSSVVIITSPPLAELPTKVFSTHDQGISITLERSTSEDGMLLLSDSGETSAAPPFLTLQSGNKEPLSVELSQRFARGYVFPKSLLPQGESTVSVTVPQSGAYDAHARFMVQAGDFEPRPGWEAKRPFDMFTFIILVIALLALALTFPMYLLSGRETELPPTRNRIPELLSVATFLLVAFVAADTLTALRGSWLENPYAYECKDDGNMWHTMLPSMAGVPTSQTPQEGCMWGMGAYTYMFPDKRQYDYYKQLGPATVTFDMKPHTPVAGSPTRLTVSIKNEDGSPATLFVDMEKLLHAVVISKDESVFAHMHPDDLRPLTRQEIDTSTFTLDYMFPKVGEYIIALDYAHGIVLESKQFRVQVEGSPTQSQSVVEYPIEGMFKGYNVSLKYPQPIAGEVETLVYTITKDGMPVALVPYLSAAMHVAIVKNDFSQYMHVHGEIHPPGKPSVPVSVKNGQVVHSMESMMVPDTFISPIEAHVLFPAPGLYTVWGQFKTQSGDLVASAFSVRVEE